MSEKIKKGLPCKKNMNPKRPTTANIVQQPSSSGMPSTSSKDKQGVNSVKKAKVNQNITIVGDGDVTMSKQSASSNLVPDFDSEYRQIAYGKFLRAMLEDCLVDEKIKMEETQLDIQMMQLTNRFQKNLALLDKTNRRLKDISFMVEQKRLIDLKSQDCLKFYKITENSNAEELLKDLAATEQSCLDKLETRNIDFGYSKESGHKQLLDAVNEAIDGLKEIKKHCNLDSDTFQVFCKTQSKLEEIEKDRLDIETLKSDFEAKFPKLNEKLLKEASEKIAQMIADDQDDDDA